MTGIADAIYAVAVAVAAPDQKLLLFARIRRNRKGEVFWLHPRDDKGCNAHASYHADGTHHLKSFNHKSLIYHRQSPDTSFRGTVMIESNPISFGAVQSINVVCDPAQFADVLRISADLLTEQTMIAVHLAEPAAEPILPHNLPPGAVVLQQRAFKDAIPWILVSLYE